MKYIALTMVREHMENIPSYRCPEGFSIRTFRPGDERHWARIERMVGEFPDQEAALAYFTREYGPHQSKLADRCFLLQNGQGEPIGTATAWDHEFEGAVRAEYHGLPSTPPIRGGSWPSPY